MEFLRQHVAAFRTMPRGLVTNLAQHVQQASAAGSCHSLRELADNKLPAVATLFTMPETMMQHVQQGPCQLLCLVLVWAGKDVGQPVYRCLLHDGLCTGHRPQMQDVQQSGAAGSVLSLTQQQQGRCCCWRPARGSLMQPSPPLCALWGTNMLLAALCCVSFILKIFSRVGVAVAAMLLLAGPLLGAQPFERCTDTACRTGHSCCGQLCSCCLFKLLQKCFL